jgi:5-methylcytosine-specific restriction endonuclease McrA
MSPFQHERRGAMTERRVAEVFAKCGGRCQCCQRKLMAGEDYEIDHVIALSKGGTDDDSNLQVLCEGCHLIKTGGDISDAAKSKRVYVKAKVPKRFRKNKGWR